MAHTRLLCGPFPLPKYHVRIHPAWSADKPVCLISATNMSCPLFCCFSAPWFFTFGTRPFGAGSRSYYQGSSNLRVAMRLCQEGVKHKQTPSDDMGEGQRMRDVWVKAWWARPFQSFSWNHQKVYIISWHRSQQRLFLHIDSKTGSVGQLQLASAPVWTVRAVTGLGIHLQQKELGLLQLHRYIKPSWAAMAQAPIHLTAVLIHQESTQCNTSQQQIQVCLRIRTQHSYLTREES